MTITNENNINLGKHCGKETGQAVLVSGDYAVLTFHADENHQRKGFLLFFTAIPQGKLTLRRTLSIIVNSGLVIIREKVMDQLENWKKTT